MTLRPVPALAVLALLAACKPDPSVVHRKAGDDLLSLSNFSGAAEEYEKSLALDPKQVKIWEKLAFCRLKTDDRDRAAEALLKTVPLMPDDKARAEVYRNVAGLYLQTPERPKAEQYLLEAVRLDPADEASITWLGEIASQAGGARAQWEPAVPEALEKAIGHYDRLIELRPGSPAAHTNRRIVLVKYLTHLGEQRQLEQRVMKRTRDPQAIADGRARLAALEAKTQELQKLLDESNEVLSKKKAPGK